MSLTTTIFRKDACQFRILIGLLAGLLAVLVAVRLEWTGSVMPDPGANFVVLSASATAAGLVGFALGSETLGSIVSPCRRCGSTGLRPTTATGAA